MDVALDLTPGRWALVVAPGAANAVMLDLTARLALRGPVQVVDGGDRFKAHIVARTLARRLREARPGVDLMGALGRVHLARAFTCYQMVTLLEGLTPSDAPTLAFDLLATFYDESVPLAESQRLLEVCLGYLARLSRRAPLAVSVRPPRLPGRGGLLERLEAAADEVWRLESPRSPSPPQLF